MQNPTLFLALSFGLIIATGLVAVLLNDWLEGALGERSRRAQPQQVPVAKRQARPGQLPAISLPQVTPGAAADSRLGWRGSRDSVWEPVAHAERSARSGKRVTANGGLPGR